MADLQFEEGVKNKMQYQIIDLGNIKKKPE